MKKILFIIFYGINYSFTIYTSNAPNPTTPTTTNQSTANKQIINDLIARKKAAFTSAQTWKNSLLELLYIKKPDDTEETKLTRRITAFTNALSPLQEYQNEINSVFEQLSKLLPENDKHIQDLQRYKNELLKAKNILDDGIKNAESKRSQLITKSKPAKST